MKSNLSRKEKDIVIVLVIVTIITITLVFYLVIKQKETEIKDPVIRNRVGYQELPTIAGHPDPNDWNQVGHDINYNYEKYDSFLLIVRHKEVIPYLASALSFILENLDKSVIIVDEEHKEEANKIALNTRIPEVMVYSEKQGLIRGNKTSLTDIKTFSSNVHLTEENTVGYPSESFNLLTINPKSRRSKIIPEYIKRKYFIQCK
jgi:hypothetical protein